MNKNIDVIALITHLCLFVLAHSLSIENNNFTASDRDVRDYDDGYCNYVA